MFKYLIFVLLGLVVVASAQPFIERETDFFGIPEMPSLSTGWFLRTSDSTTLGFSYPSASAIFRTDRNASIRSHYGRWGLFQNGYSRIVGLRHASGHSH